MILCAPRCESLSLERIKFDATLFQIDLPKLRVAMVVDALSVPNKAVDVLANALREKYPDAVVSH